MSENANTLALRFPFMVDDDGSFYDNSVIVVAIREATMPTYEWEC